MSTAAGRDAANRCANCAEALCGPFCSACGQRAVTHAHTLPEFLAEALEDLTHADSRLWRTLLPLLFRPGFLTLEFLHGRRVRYLPPLRLYLLISAAFFLLLASGMERHAPAIALEQSAADETGNSSMTVVIGDRSDAPGVAKVRAVLERRLAEADAKLATEKRPEVIADLLRSRSAGRAALAALDRPGAARADAAPGRAGAGADPCAGARYDGPGHSWVQPRLAAACQRVALDSGRELIAEFLHNVPRAIFLFLPLIGAIMKLLYVRPRRYYVEHLLFLVHNHAFVFLLLLLFVLGDSSAHALAGARVFPAWLGITADLICVAWILGYLYAAMRRVYGESRLRTSCKFAIMSVVYVSGSLVLAALTALVTALGA